MPTWAKMIPYLKIEDLKNHTLSRGTYLYSPYTGVRSSPPSGNCHMAMPQQESDRKKPFHLVWTSCKKKKKRCCVARSHSNTLQMILLPSHTNRCTCFYINALRIKNNMLQLCNIHTASHSQTNTNFYYSVICIITVANKASTSAYFFPLFRASCIFLLENSSRKLRALIG